jgi:GNAT superfamily N-acetyltransferase
MGDACRPFVAIGWRTRWASHSDDSAEPLGDTSLMRIRKAREDESAKLSELAYASKATWGYSASQLALWRDDLTIVPADIARKPTFVAEVEDDVGRKAVGFFVLEPLPRVWELAHLWVAPESMGLGVGRALLAKALSVAIAGGATAVSIDADPNAEAFYLAHGARRTGSVGAPIAGNQGRQRPQLLLCATPQGD